MKNRFRPRCGSTLVYDIQPEAVGWNYLAYQQVALQPGESYEYRTEGVEAALLPLTGDGEFRVGGASFPVARKGVFAAAASLLYVPPGNSVTALATTRFEFTLGAAPAEGKYPVRQFTPKEMRVELRGGGAAQREVHHVLSHPLPAERLIVYEVYVGGGGWSGWPPHCHDGFRGSPYLEETYLFYLDPPEGFAIQNSYRLDDGREEAFTVRQGDLVLTAPGFHSTIVAPGYNMYFLNYLAGSLYDDRRATAPYSDPRYTWIVDRWETNYRNLPIVGVPRERP